MKVQLVQRARVHVDARIQLGSTQIVCSDCRHPEPTSHALGGGDDQNTMQLGYIYMWCSLGPMEQLGDQQGTAVPLLHSSLSVGCCHRMRRISARPLF